MVRFWFASGPNYEPDLNTDDGHLEVARPFFGGSDIDVNLKDESFRSPFSYATKNGHSEMVQLFLTRGNIDVNSKDRGL